MDCLFFIQRILFQILTLYIWLSAGCPQRTYLPTMDVKENSIALQTWLLQVTIIYRNDFGNWFFLNSNRTSWGRQNYYRGKNLKSCSLLDTISSGEPQDISPIFIFFGVGCNIPLFITLIEVYFFWLGRFFPAEIHFGSLSAPSTVIASKSC